MKKYSAVFTPGKFYHVYNHAVSNDLLFRNWGNYNYFLNLYKKYFESTASTYAYCLLPNHFHLLIKIPEEVTGLEVSEQFRRMFIAYSRAFNLQQRRRGTLFERFVKRVEVDSDEYLLWLVYYIHRNPIHHRYARDFKHYRWSSYRLFISSGETGIRREEVFDLFGSRKLFLEFHRRNLKEDILSKKLKWVRDLDME